MTTYTLTGLQFNVSNLNSLDDFSRSTLTIIAADDATLSYRVITNSGDGIPITKFKDTVYEVDLNGQSVLDTGFGTEETIFNNRWGGNRSTVYLHANGITGDASIFVLDGDPLPSPGSDQLAVFLAGFDNPTDVTRGSFAPGGQIDLSQLPRVEINQDDQIDGGSENDVFDAGVGNDVVTGGFGDDQINGGDGRDNLTGGFGNDTLNGGVGRDVLNGNEGDDTMEGGSEDDSLNGGDGDDHLTGGGGDDLLVGSLGDDTLIGGAGDDQLLGGIGKDRLLGGDGDDRLSGEDDLDRLDGGKGADALFGGKGKDKLSGGAGNDNLSGQTGGDTIAGGAGADRLTGGGGSDIMRGGSGRDILLGGNGADTLGGDKGADLLNGGKGNDLLTGGAGADTFEFTGPVRQDTITDFRDDKDTLLLDQDLWGGGLTVEELVDTQGAVTADGFVLTLNDKDAILLEGVTEGTILYDDIEFL